MNSARALHPVPRFVLLAGVVSAIALFGASARASDSVTVTVNATVSGVCKFNSGQNPTVTVANSGSVIDPSLSGPATGNANVTYRCTNGTSPTFSVPATATVTCGACGGGASMSVTMSSSGSSAGTGMGNGNDKTLTVTGSLAQSVYEDAKPGTYTGTISVSVNP